MLCPTRSSTRSSSRLTPSRSQGFVETDLERRPAAHVAADLDAVAVDSAVGRHRAEPQTDRSAPLGGPQSQRSPIPGDAVEVGAEHVFERPSRGRATECRGRRTGPRAGFPDAGCDLPAVVQRPPKLTERAARENEHDGGPGQHAARLEGPSARGSRGGRCARCRIGHVESSVPSMRASRRCSCFWMSSRSSIWRARSLPRRFSESSSSRT